MNQLKVQFNKRGCRPKFRLDLRVQTEVRAGPQGADGGSGWTSGCGWRSRLDLRVQTEVEAGPRQHRHRSSPASLKWLPGFRLAQPSTNQIPSPQCRSANHRAAWVGSGGVGWSPPLLLQGAGEPWGAVIRCAGQEEESHHGLSGGGLVRPQSHCHQLHHHGEYHAHAPTSCQLTGSGQTGSVESRDPAEGSGSVTEEMESRAAESPRRAAVSSLHSCDPGQSWLTKLSCDRQ